jgi:hypothetical protein
VAGSDEPLGCFDHHVLRPHARPGAWIWTGSALAVLLASSEYLTWRASKDLVPADRTDPGTVDPGEVILVLGCPANSRGRVSFVQRWRVRIAVRSTDPGEARFVFTGANLRGHTSEAAAMARYAVEVLGVPATSVVLEEQSTSTWGEHRVRAPSDRRRHVDQDRFQHLPRSSGPQIPRDAGASVGRSPTTGQRLPARELAPLNCCSSAMNGAGPGASARPGTRSRAVPQSEAPGREATDDATEIGGPAGETSVIEEQVLGSRGVRRLRGAARRSGRKSRAPSTPMGLDRLTEGVAMCGSPDSGKVAHSSEVRRAGPSALPRKQSDRP